MSCKGCGPSKHSPEYYAQQKPENHAGCCGGGKAPEEKKKRKIKLGCFVRYKVSS